MQNSQKTIVLLPTSLQQKKRKKRNKWKKRESYFSLFSSYCLFVTVESSRVESTRFDSRPRVFASICSHLLAAADVQPPLLSMQVAIWNHLMETKRKETKGKERKKKEIETWLSHYGSKGTCETTKWDIRLRALRGEAMRCLWSVCSRVFYWKRVTPWRAHRIALHCNKSTEETKKQRTWQRRRKEE